MNLCKLFLHFATLSVLTFERVMTKMKLNNLLISYTNYLVAHIPGCRCARRFIVLMILYLPIDPHPSYIPCAV